MEGKGWFVLYGVLLLLVLYLVISLSGVKGDLKDVRAQLTDLQNQATQVEQATPEPSATPEPEPSNDLSTASGRDAQRKDDLASIADSLAAYKEASGSYPTGLNELTPDHIGAVPADPSAPRFNYRYRRTASGFLLTSVLEQAGDPADAQGDGKADKVFTVTERSRS